MPDYPLPTLAATVDADGISAPAYSDILASLQASYRSIYGGDAYLDADSQDGQWLAIQAKAIFDSNMTAIAVYNEFSPATAQGAGLSSVVKINGIHRRVASFSTVDVLLVGTAGTIIDGGVVGGVLGDQVATSWLLPPEVAIPFEGEITVSATAADPGAINAAAGTVNRILTPVPGWQTVVNAAAATPGAPIETDAQLRQRQARSTAIPALTPLDAIWGAVGSLDGVASLAIVENDTGAVDFNGIPPHSIAVVVDGGDAQEIAATIAATKTPGTGTYGPISEIVVDDRGIPATIHFYPLTRVMVGVVINLRIQRGYSASTGDLLAQNTIAWLSGLPIGAASLLSKLWTQMTTGSPALDDTFNVLEVLQWREAGPPAAADVPMAFYEAATSDATHVTVNLV